MEKVSVVIITYNRPLNILFRAINSALNQDYKNIEVFVVNDAPENSELAHSIQRRIDEIDDDRITYLSYDRNHGSNYARNYGLKHSTGAYIGFLDDDDEWYSYKISEQVAVIETDSSIGLVSCGFDIIRDGKVVGHKSTYSSYDHSIDNLLRFNYIGGSSFPLLRRETVEQVGGFDESMKACQEYELWIRLRKEAGFRTIEKPLGAYYDSGDSTYKGNPEKYYLGDKRILEKHEKLFNKYTNAYNSHLNGMALQWLLRKRIHWYLEYKTKAVRVKPFSSSNFTVLKKLIDRAKREKQ